LDYNISDDHKLTLRNNFKGFADNLEWTPTVLILGNQDTTSITLLIVLLPKKQITTQTFVSSTVNDVEVIMGFSAYRNH
jgi:hypothetical protein